MSPRFQPDADSRLVDPEAYDASEQEFAASLEAPARAARFVPEQNADGAGAKTRGELKVEDSASPTLELQPEPDTPSPEANAAGDRPPMDSSSWREEVAARVTQYRSRRPRAPRYPSLQLKFDSPPIAQAETPQSPPVLLDSMARDEVASGEPRFSGAALPSIALEPAGKLIEFPRASAFAPRPLEELAEPVLERPRILDVPEVEPPPPALGGILIEPVEQPEPEKRPGIEVPLQSAALGRRLLAAAIDGAIIAAGFSLFAYIFLRITGATPPARTVLVNGTALLGVLWAAYQYLLVIYSGSTPGLRLARLQLSRFDGTPVGRRGRRWRVLASILSGFSLGLGYAWCFLDEDQLCWHDRITHTYMAPVNRG